MQRYLFIFLGGCLTACLSGPGFLKKNTSENRTRDVDQSSQDLETNSDSSGATTATLDVDSQSAQVLKVADDQALSGVSISFPPGSIGVSTVISVQEGVSIDDPALEEALGVSDADDLVEAGKSVVVTSSEPTDATVPFTIALLVDAAVSLQNTSSQLVVLYRVTVASNGGTLKAGMIPNSALTVIDGVVYVDAKHFGVYQLFYAKQEFTTGAEIDSSLPIQSKTGAEIVAPPVQQRDQIRPSGSLVISAPAVTNAVTIACTLSFSETVYGLSLASLSLTNAVVVDGSLVKNEAKYDFAIKPSKEGDIKIGLAADRVTDAAGNGNDVVAEVTLRYDGTAPSVTKVTSTKTNGVYTTGTTIALDVEFSELVTVSGTPHLKLETGAVDRNAAYLSGSGTKTLTFSYGISPGDETSDLDYVSTGALVLNGGTIADAATNTANLTLPAPGSSASLSGGKNLVIDTIQPGDPTISIDRRLGALALSWQSTDVTTVGFLLLRKSGSTVDFTPDHGEIYAVGDAFNGSETVIAKANGLTYLDSALTNGVVYHYKLFAYDAAMNYSPGLNVSAKPAHWNALTYLKAGNAEASDGFGAHVALDGDTLVVGVPAEDSSQTSITNGTGTSSDNSAASSGAVYVYRLTGGSWVQEAYIKAPNADAGDGFGSSVAIDGETLVVAAVSEGSNQTTITNGTTASSDNSLSSAGAVYVFKRTGSTWASEAYLKAPNAETFDTFGSNVDISGDTIVVGAQGEDSGETAILNGGGVSANNSVSGAGAAYIFERTGSTWAFTAYLKAPNPTSLDAFGNLVAISGDTVVVGAWKEDSAGTAVINGTSVTDENTATDAGAAYVFRRTSGLWAHESYLKAPNANANFLFGNSVAIDGDTIAIGSRGETSNQTTITNGSTASSNTSLTAASAVYVFTRSGVNWAPSAYLKAPNAAANSYFGLKVSLDGDLIVVGSEYESSNQTTITNGSTASANVSAASSGAAYVFKRTNSLWTNEAYLKVPNADAGDRFGNSVAVSGDLAVVAASYEDSNQTTITSAASASTDNSVADSGAVYVLGR